MDHIKSLLSKYHVGSYTSDECRDGLIDHLSEHPEDGADLLIEMQDRRVITGFITKPLSDD